MSDKTYRQQCEYLPRVLKGKYGKLGRLSRIEQCAILRREAEALIRHLYRPDVERGWVARSYLPAGVGDEAINWGDLHVVDVRCLSGGGFLVEVEEADPGCPAFIAWMAGWLSKWGWRVEIRTEW